MRELNREFPGKQRLSAITGKQKGTLAKMARGEMVRFLAENGIENPEGLKEFHELGFIYCEELSDKGKYVFLRS